MLSCASSKKKADCEKKNNKSIPPLEEEVGFTGTKLIHFKSEEEFLNYNPEQDKLVIEPGLDFDISEFIPPIKKGEDIPEETKDEDEKGDE